MSIAKVKQIVESAAIYVPGDCEAIQIISSFDDHFLGQGEESGESYEVKYDEVDLKNSLFYKLQLIEVE